MTKFNKKAILSAKDSILSGGKTVKDASDKLTKIAQDMETTETAPSPEQVKEIIESISSVAQEIVQQADTVANDLETIVGEAPDDVVPPVDNEPPVIATELDEETKEKMAAQDEKIEELETFKETNEKEKMATDYAKIFPSNQQQAKYTEFMKMDKPNSELKTILSATENVLKSVQKSASSGLKTNETIIFKESNQKFASTEGFSGHARSLTEI